MFSPHPFGIYYVTHFYYVKRVDSNTYQFQNNYGTSYSATSPSKMGNAGDTETKALAQIEEIDKGLICDRNGEERVLIECYLRKQQTFNKQKLGLFVLDPPTKRTIDGMSNNFFVYRFVIIPKPGLFPVR